MVLALTVKNIIRLPLETVRISHTENFFSLVTEYVGPVSLDVKCVASILKSSSEELGKNCSEHYKHEHEQHHDIEHDGQ